MKQPLVSVIIPCWGKYVEYLPRCLKSVHKQTYKNVEILIISDKTNANAACNAGMKKAKGKYIAFLGADDTYLPDKIETQVEVMENFDKCVLCTCWSEDNRFNIQRISKALSCVTYKDILKAFNYSSGSTYMIHNYSNIVFDESLLSGQEYDFALRLLKNTGKYAYCIPRVLVKQFSTPGQISTDWNKKIRGIWQLAKKHGRDYTLFDWVKVLGLFGVYFSGFFLGVRIYKLITYIKEKYE